jgi:glycosyltransferase involved in cell wall biosynthesis
VKVLFLTKHSRAGASSRYRTFQYLPWYEQAGIECRVSSLFDEGYLAHRYRAGTGRVIDIASAFLRRVAALAKAHRFDLVVVEKEVIPYFPALPERLLRWSGVPYVVDYDDALFHQYDLHPRPWIRGLLGRKIASVMCGARLVTAGNHYLAEYARGAGARSIEVIPTVIDLGRYPPADRAARPTEFRIGWIGSPSTAKYLQHAASALAQVCANGQARVQLIGAGDVSLPGVPLDVLPWAGDTELELLRRCDVGIMPLPDTPWERGKCGFKLIQYMAAGLPVVASPVGANEAIVDEGVNGYFARNHHDWVSALERLRDAPELRQTFAQAGREKVERHYCLQVTGPRMVSLLREAATPVKA